MIDKLIFKISFVANFALLLFGIWDWFNVTVFKLWLITGLVCFFAFSVYALKREAGKKYRKRKIKGAVTNCTGRFYET